MNQDPVVNMVRFLFQGCSLNDQDLFQDSVGFCAENSCQNEEKDPSRILCGSLSRFCLAAFTSVFQEFRAFRSRSFRDRAFGFLTGLETVSSEDPIRNERRSIQLFRLNPVQDPWRNPVEFELTRSEGLSRYHVQAISR
jgi:hypothetical protein